MEGLIQQVNLYQLVEHRKKIPFDANLLVLITLGVSILLTLISVYSHYVLRDLQTEADRLDQENAGLRAEIAVLKQRIKPQKTNHLLEVKKQHLLDNVREARQLQRFIQTQISTDNPPYSAYFRGLAQSAVKGLWLQNITIGNAGDGLVIAGETLQPDLIPQLLQNLESEKVFQGYAFGKVGISRKKSAETDQTVVFRLQSIGYEETVDAE